MAINNFNVGVGTTSQLTRYRYVATGGETSVSGTDADGKTLSYTVGLEQVFLNGVNLVRGQDYTATNGTSVGALTALVASDVVEVFAFVPFNIANALTVSTVDAKGDLLVGTGADAVGRLAVGTNNQLLAADSSTASGLKWANPGMTLIKTQSFSAVSSSSVEDVFSATYDNYKILLNCDSITTSSQSLILRLRVSGTDNSSSNYLWSGTVTFDTSTSIDLAKSSGATTSFRIGTMYFTNAITFGDITISNPFRSVRTGYQATFSEYDGTNSLQRTYAGNMSVTTSYTGFSIIPGANNITGTVRVYGYNN